MNTVTKSILVTPEMARDLLEHNSFKYQRGLRQTHMAMLASEMTRGTFTPHTQIAFATANGTRSRVLINGQHTLAAVVASGIPQFLDVVDHHVHDDMEIAELYARYDQHKVRTLPECLAAFNLTELTTLKPTKIIWMGAALRLIHFNFPINNYQPTKVPADTLRDLIIEYADTASQYFKLVEGASEGIYHALGRRATLSIALVTLRFAPQAMGRDKVEAFWRGLAFDDGLSRDDPRKHAHEHMYDVMSGGLMAVRSGRTQRRSFQVSDSLLFLAHCWNLWCADRKYIRPSLHKEGSRKFSLANTPFKDRQ